MVMTLLLLALGCSDKADGSDSGSGDGGSSSDGGSGSDSGTGACATITADRWEWRGECPQMPTPVVIAVDGCAMTLDYDAVGGMTMGMPYAGTVGVDTVTFADDNSVTGCVGTVLSADSLEGTCDGGCTFTLDVVPPDAR